MMGLTCDCLNDCGDDPALRTGKAKPCPSRRDRLHQESIRKKKQEAADVLCQKFGVVNVLDLVETQNTHIQRLQDALLSMLEQFTKTPSSLKDTEARGKAQAALLLAKGGAA